MACGKRIIRAFVRVGETTEATQFTILGEGLPSAGQHFVAVGLMTYVPDYSVVRSVEHLVESDSQFDRSHARREVAGIDRQRIYKELS